MSLQKACSISRQTRRTLASNWRMMAQSHSTKGAVNYVNKFFFDVFSKVSSWQSMREFHVTILDDVTELILNSTYQALASSTQNASIAKCPGTLLHTPRPSWQFLPSFGRGNTSVTSRTDKFFVKALDTLADVDDKTLSAYLHHKATAWYQGLQFPPVHSPDRMDDTHAAEACITRGGSGDPSSACSSAPAPSARQSSSHSTAYLQPQALAPTATACQVAPEARSTSATASVTATAKSRQPRLSWRAQTRAEPSVKARSATWDPRALLGASGGALWLSIRQVTPRLSADLSRALRPTTHS